MSILSFLLRTVLDWLFAKFADFLRIIQKDKENHESAKKDAEAQTAPLKKAEGSESEKEVDDAIDEVSKRF